MIFDSIILFTPQTHTIMNTIALIGILAQAVPIFFIIKISILMIKNKSLTAAPENKTKTVQLK